MKRARVAYNGQILEAYPIDQSELILLSSGEQVAENALVWLPPIEVNTIFTLGLNYADHAKELAFNAPDKPLVFLKSANALVGHLARTVRPDNVGYMHYECELAVVIGKSGKNISEENALEYVQGYTIANDYAIRDYLENYYRPNLKVKNRDATTPLGPWLVDKDDISDPMNLSLRTFVNGVKTQEGNTKDMVFSIAKLISYLSSIMTLSYGDIILTGTPEGLADVKVGDEVVCEIEGLGALKNTISAPNSK